MNISRQRLLYLFNCYYNKTATPQERDELFGVINAGVSDKELSSVIRQAWDELHLETPVFSASKTDTMLRGILREKSVKTKKKSNKLIFLWTRLVSAAAVLLFTSTGIYFYLSNDKPVAKKQIVKVKHSLLNDALPGGNKAILTLSNGQTIILDNAQNGTLAKQGTTTVNKTMNGQLVYNAMNNGTANTALSINTITTPRGGQYQITLPDGTDVWLNSASSISFPTRFSGNFRNVEITGEAYFEVTKSKKMPFRVKTNRAEIEVLGTHFNVNAYDDESLMKTTLLEGAVNVKNGLSTSKLIPGQQAQIDPLGKTKVLNHVDVEDEVAWKNGIFQFNDAGVDMILRQASRWYDVDVTYKGKVPNREFTGRISRNVKASELLNMLKYTGVDIKIEGNKIIVL
jgi:transmembrane sensor